MGPAETTDYPLQFPALLVYRHFRVCHVQKHVLEARRPLHVLGIYLGEKNLNASNARVVNEISSMDTDLLSEENTRIKPRTLNSFFDRVTHTDLLLRDGSRCGVHACLL